MKKLIIATFLVFALAQTTYAASDYYLKIKGVDGETTKGAALAGQTFVLDGTSSDDSRIERFLWTQVSGPSVTLSNSATAKASFVPTVAGTYVFELNVTDATGRTYLRAKVEASVTTASSPTAVTSPTSPQEGGKVEYEWKVEEGESAQGESGEKGGTEDINIGVGELSNTGAGQNDINAMTDPEPITPDFSILLGGGSSDEGRAKAAEILMQGAQEEGVPVESISLNFEKIEARVNQKVKLFGFIPATAEATVEINAKQEIKVKFPWWAYLARGKDRSVGERVFTAISNVLKTKHDTVKNAIGNIR